MPTENAMKEHCETGSRDFDFIAETRWDAPPCTALSVASRRNPRPSGGFGAHRWRSYAVLLRLVRTTRRAYELAGANLVLSILECAEN